MRERDVDELTIWKYPLDLAAEAGVDAVIVAHMEEPAPCEILAQPNDLFVTQPNVAVSRDVEKRIIPQLVVHDAHFRLDLVDVERGALTNGGEQIRQTRGIRVPVAAAVVLESSDGETSDGGRGKRDAGRGESAKARNKE